MRKVNPYKIDRPFAVSFSGGRTSGFMLRQIIDAYGGVLPDDSRVIFNNTGNEHERTLEFVDRIARVWGVQVRWLEYCLGADGEHSFCEVDFESASRDAEPFRALIRKKGYLPNPVVRVCTSNLKIRTSHRFLADEPGFEDGWTNAVGLRADEPRRVHRLKSDKAAEDPFCPMYAARHTLEDVTKFWDGHPLDLDLPLHGNQAGNCVGCFLKARYRVETLMAQPQMERYFDFWMEAEESELDATTGATFRTDRPTYRQMMASVKAQGAFTFDGEDTLPCMCTD